MNPDLEKNKIKIKAFPKTLQTFEIPGAGPYVRSNTGVCPKATEESHILSYA